MGKMRYQWRNLTLSLSARLGLIVLLLVMLLVGYLQSLLEPPAPLPATPVATAPVDAHYDRTQLNVSLRCIACHGQQYADWSGSHHAWAQRPPTAELDGEAFSGKQLLAHGDTLGFSMQQQQPQVSSRQSAKSWPVIWAIGKEPLVQYLLPDQNGGFHTTSAAWDVHNKQWFDMFAGAERQLGDWGHWLGRGMNWNSQCAWCHMSGFDKNYDNDSDRWNSKWIEPGVSCVQCHGPVLQQALPHSGCLISPTTTRQTKAINDNCASCHSRRDEFDHQFRAGSSFEQHFLLNLPSINGLWWPTGRQRDEVYTHTGLQLSNMGHAGVGCIDCHDAHSAKPKLEVQDNTLCMSCHQTGIKGAPLISSSMAHSHHPPNSQGNKCINCHMPHDVYMARDPRRDHAFTSPDPQLGIEFGIPNACNDCHKDKDFAWANAHVNDWYGPNKLLFSRERSRAVARAHAHEAAALQPLLQALAREPNAAWQATLLELLQDWQGDPQVIEVAGKHLGSPHALVRQAALKALGSSQARLSAACLQDQVRSVRLQAAWNLRGNRQLLPDDHAAFAELLAVAKHQADQPAGVMKLASIYAARDNSQCEQWFKKAIKWEPNSSVALRDYAVYLAGRGDLAAAEEKLLQALQKQPDNPNLHYLLALGYCEQNRLDKGLDSLDRAIKLDPGMARAYYNRGLLLQQTGKTAQALQDLLNAARLQSDSALYVYTLGTLLYQQGQTEAAREAFLQALKRDATFAPAKQALQALP